MQTFKDAKGREWRLSLTIGKARDVLNATGVDLLQPEKTKPTLPEILTDEYKVAEIVQVILGDQFAQQGVDPAAVLEEDWDGATTRAAYDALLQELQRFFEDRGQQGRAAILAKTRRAIEAAGALIHERVQALDPEAEVRRRFADAAGSTSGGPQDASGSIPGPSPSGS